MKKDAPLPETMVLIGEAADIAYGTLGGIERPSHLAEILDQLWPDCVKGELSGKTLMRPADAIRLEALFKLFGVPMLVKENSIEVLGRAYDVFGQAFSGFVSQKLRFPGSVGSRKNFKEYLYKWPADWVEYIEAVASENFSEARRLAVKLNVLSPDCEYPADTFVPQSSNKVVNA